MMENLEDYCATFIKLKDTKHKIHMILGFGIVFSGRMLYNYLYLVKNIVQNREKTG